MTWPRAALRRLSVRLIASHVLVAVIGAVTAYVIVRLAAPALFNEHLRLGQGQGPGMGRGLALRAAFADAVDRANLFGALAGVLAAGVVGAVSAHRFLDPLRRIGVATRRISAGHYDERVDPPKEIELAALAEDVNQLGGELGRIEATRVRLLGEVAHEMRTPLTVIDGYVEGMIDEVLPANADNLAVLRGETARLRRLADDLSALSRAAEHRLELAPGNHDLGEVAAEAAGRLRPQAQDARVALTIATHPLPATFDPDRIGQVVTNLVHNAIRATPPGGTVTVTTQGGAHQADPPSIIVQDTGEGLAAKDLDRIFERFYRVPGRRGPAGGSGIGLTIARDIARAHGGDLTVTSAGPGQGSRFVLTLPSAPPPTTEATDPTG